MTLVTPDLHHIQQHCLDAAVQFNALHNERVEQLQHATAVRELELQTEFEGLSGEMMARIEQLQEEVQGLQEFRQHKVSQLELQSSPNLRSQAHQHSRAVVDQCPAFVLGVCRGQFLEGFHAWKACALTLQAASFERLSQLTQLETIEVCRLTLHFMSWRLNSSWHNTNHLPSSA